MYEIIVILKALTEVAGVAMIGQCILWVIAGAKRDQNLVHGLFGAVIAPVAKLARFSTRRIVLGQHIGLAAFFLLIILWVALTAVKSMLALDASAASS